MIFFCKKNEYKANLKKNTLAISETSKVYNLAKYFF